MWIGSIVELVCHTPLLYFQFEFHTAYAAAYVLR